MHVWWACDIRTPFAFLSTCYGPITAGALLLQRRRRCGCAHARRSATTCNCHRVLVLSR